MSCCYMLYSKNKSDKIIVGYQPCHIGAPNIGSIRRFYHFQLLWKLDIWCK